MVLLRGSMPATASVILPGHISNRAEFFAALDLFIMPSRSEAWGLAALEAMAHGVPVVASNTGGLPEMMEANETGWLVTPGDPRELADAIERAAAWKPREASRHGPSGARTVQAILRSGNRRAHRKFLPPDTHMSISSRNANIIALLLCVFFVSIAVPWIDKPGIQTDEALFAGGIYPPFNPQFTIRIFHHNYPLMEMSYVGALKARIWAVIFKLWRPSPASVRVPSAILGALSIWWLYRLLARTLGIRAAMVGSALLSTDPLYVLYSRWDHGPVVIQHLCLVGAMLALIRFHQERRLVWLAVGFLALGLGLWEKAIFAWLLSGLVVAALLRVPTADPEGAQPAQCGCCHRGFCGGSTAADRLQRSSGAADRSGKHGLVFGECSGKDRGAQGDARGRRDIWVDDVRFAARPAAPAVHPGRKSDGDDRAGDEHAAPFMDGFLSLPQASYFFRWFGEARLGRPRCSS